MQNELRISSGDFYLRSQMNAEANLKTGHCPSGGQLFPFEDARDGRGRDLRFFGNRFDTSVVVPHTTHIDFCLSLRHFCHLVPAKAVLIIDR